MLEQYKNQAEVQKREEGNIITEIKEGEWKDSNTRETKVKDGLFCNGPGEKRKGITEQKYCFKA